MPFMNSEDVCEMPKIGGDANDLCARPAVYRAEWVEPVNLGAISKKNLCGTHASLWRQSTNPESEAGKFKVARGRFAIVAGVKGL